MAKQFDRYTVVLNGVPLIVDTQRPGTTSTS